MRVCATKRSFMLMTMRQDDNIDYIITYYMMLEADKKNETRNNCIANATGIAPHQQIISDNKNLNERLVIHVSVLSGFVFPCYFHWLFNITTPINFNKRNIYTCIHQHQPDALRIDWSKRWNLSIDLYMCRFHQFYSKLLWCLETLCMLQMQISLHFLFFYLSALYFQRFHSLIMTVEWCSIVLTTSMSIYSKYIYINCVFFSLTLSSRCSIQAFIALWSIWISWHFRLFAFQKSKRKNIFVVTNETKKWCWARVTMHLRLEQHNKMCVVYIILFNNIVDFNKANKKEKKTVNQNIWMNVVCSQRLNQAFNK